jgi:hypothetical protein
LVASRDPIRSETTAGEEFSRHRSATAPADASEVFQAKLTNITEELELQLLQGGRADAPTPGSSSRQPRRSPNPSDPSAGSSNVNAAAIVAWSTGAVVGGAPSNCTLVACPTNANEVWVSELEPVNSGKLPAQRQWAIVAITVTTPAITGCANTNAAPDWSATVWTGGNLSGDEFTMRASSNLTTTLEGSCGSISGQKWRDHSNDGNRLNDLPRSTRARQDGGWRSRPSRGHSETGFTSRGCCYELRRTYASTISPRHDLHRV